MVDDQVPATFHTGLRLARDAQQVAEILLSGDSADLPVERVTVDRRGP